MVERCTICASKIVDGKCSNEKCINNITPKEPEKETTKDRRRTKRDSK